MTVGISWDYHVHWQVLLIRKYPLATMHLAYVPSHELAHDLKRYYENTEVQNRRGNTNPLYDVIILQHPGPVPSFGNLL